MYTFCVYLYRAADSDERMQMSYGTVIWAPKNYVIHIAK